VDLYASGHHHAFFAGVDEAGMVHLGVGALGGNARAFSGGDVREPHSFALLDIEGGKLEVRVHPAPGFADEAAGRFGPDKIDGPLGRLQRADNPVPLRP
jgi:hypothetical protein